MRLPLMYRFQQAISALARFANAMFFVRVPHATRLLVNTMLMLISFLLLTFSLMEFELITGFYWSIIATIVHQFSQAFGEATIMGYLKGLPSDLVMTFGSGTGISGYTGVLTSLFLSALGISHGKSFLILGLFVIPYFLAFAWLDEQRKEHTKDETMYPDLNRAECEPVRVEPLPLEASP